MTAINTKCLCVMLYVLKPTLKELFPKNKQNTITITPNIKLISNSEMHIRSNK